ncbi:MAG TPA: molybdenum cofactor guanylyltransferase [Micromonosporaceae bacterium]|nr:molybdenum cofactor guanylyltransferase [Micromonosporaceae bacterium]
MIDVVYGATRFGAIVLAGGRARRMGGVRKPMQPVAGVPMIERVLAAVAPVGQPIVVGPADVVVSVAVPTMEETPPGGGPVAAIGAVFDAHRAALADVVVIVAGDLPLLTVAAVRELTATVRHGRVDGAVFVDPDGRRQWLCGAWWSASIAGSLATLAAARGDLAGAALRDLLGSLAVADVSHEGEPPPWFDCDTDDDIRRAEEWLNR